MSLAMNPGDVLDQMSTLFTTLWPILVIILGIFGTRILILVSQGIFRSDHMINLGDNFRVWNWRRKGWMEKNSYKFTDKMIQDYRRKHRL